MSMTREDLERIMCGDTLREDLLVFSGYVNMQGRCGISDVEETTQLIDYILEKHDLD